MLNYSYVQKQEIFGNRAGICKPNNDREIVGIVCWFWQIFCPKASKVPPKEPPGPSGAGSAQAAAGPRC